MTSDTVVPNIMSKYTRFAKTTRIKSMVWTIKESRSQNSAEPLAAVESHHRLTSVCTEHRTDRASQAQVLPSTFTDTTPLESNDEGTTENLGSLEENASLVEDTNVNRNLKPRGSYRRYNFDQIDNLLTW